MRALQKLAEKQGHPGAAVQDLQNFGFAVPPDVEAAAAGVTEESLKKAVEQGGPLASRLATARAKPLSSDQTRRIGDAERQYARDRDPLEKKYVQDVVQITGLSEGRLRKILFRNQGTPTSWKKAIAEIEKSLGRQLSAGDASRFASSREDFLSARESQRKAYARQVGKIAGVPQWVVLELVP